MKEIFSFIRCYLKFKFISLTIILISIGIFIIVFSLYSIPLESILYGTILIASFLLLVGIIDFQLFYRKYNILTSLKNNILINNMKLPKSNNLLEKEYQNILEIIAEDRLDIINKKDETLNDMVDYYTIWAHQIKTPISAMRIMLQSDNSNTNIDLLEQLFKIEQYVEMVLQFIRTEDMGSDLLIKTYVLDDIVKQAVRKYSKLFIRKKIRLNYQALNYDVLTDEKWLVFVLEQILSNALKYTNEGEISIYMDEDKPDTLVIKDTGIGIEEEDLPRIFEKGFTGFNGRADKKSTGIGLFLCKRILNKLSHTISIESEIDKGTKIKIGLDMLKININD
ncbi:sensor histidine kinase [Tissierella sp. Yu-01]|uniref:sensor histidine kinase n=1 Tax=Tissierella sp. Yu-01 TaxID=3035694 RepID=UPI00240D5C23|nr:sensor histidine kinase [Tissierella sp. Yu-01]WFA09325.1 sensor histidine kinase [Tissierella sp. Yu-01]